MSDDDDPLVWRGMRFYEDEAVARATEIALRGTRQAWLPILEAWRAKTDNIMEQVQLDAEIRRLRRKLGIKPAAEAVRAAGAKRVR